METKRKLQVSNPIPTGFHRGNRAVSAFQTHGNHWFPLWKPGGNYLETPGFHVVSTRFPRFGNLSFRPVDYVHTTLPLFQTIKERTIEVYNNLLTVR